MTPKSGRALAWLTFVIGILVSVAGNIGHAASNGMQPGEWAGAAFWPTALLLSVEILVRVRWQPERRWTVARFTGLVVVSIVAAILSYLHLRSLLIFWQYGTFQGTIGPLAVDGLMLIAASALLSISKERPQAVDNPVEEWRPEPTKVPAPAPAQKQVLVPVSAPDSIDVTPDVDGPELLPAEAVPSKLHVVKSVSSDAAEEAALQAWLDSGKSLSSAQVADIMGVSKSTAHRRMTTQWARRIQR